jgi:4-hydroxy-tetrahydrodipicolinate reductase
VLELAAARIPLLVAANTSMGVTVLLELVRRAAQSLPARFDIEISEAHHRNKIDAPSGTALALGAAAQMARGGSPSGVPAIRGHEPPGARGPADIGYSVTRGGDLVGEHTVHFIGAGERLTLSHVATDRAVFARGALAAGGWLARQPPGYYQMQAAVGEK